MAKAKIEFDLENIEDRALHKKMISVEDVYIALNDIANEIFRPARKHGYKDSHVNECIKLATDAKCEIKDFDIDGYEDNVVTSAISKLEKDFYEILEQYNIDMDL